MQPLPTSKAVRFGPFQLEFPSGELRKNGRKTCLQEQVFRLLTALLERPGEVITREELQAQLWPDHTVVEFGVGINSAVKRLRDVLGDSALKPKYVETVARRGYRFVAAVEWDSLGAPAAVEEPRPPTDIASTIRVNEAVPQKPVDPPHRGLLAKVITIVTVMAVAVGVWQLSDWFARPSHRRIASIAVLPLQDLSGSSTENYFADGLTDELIGELGKIGGLRVISRTSVMRYRQLRRSVQEIAREVGVESIVDGTVLRSGNRVRITVHLFQAAPEAQIWTQSFERELSEVMLVQDEVAREIASEVRVRLTPQERTRLTNAHSVNPRAHEAYLKGLHFFHEWTDESLDKSLACFQKAVEIDPQYGIAYAALADAYLALTGHGLMRPRNAAPKAEQAARQALELDNTLVAAHSALGTALFQYERDWAGADRELRRAIELNPNDVDARLSYADYLSDLGDPNRAVTEARRALELDPLSLVVNAFLGRFLRDARRFDEAIQQCRNALELDPNFAHGHWCLGLSYFGQRRYEDAILELQKSRALGGGSVATWALGCTYAVAGRKAEARHALEQLPRTPTAAMFPPLSRQTSTHVWTKKIAPSNF